jgi:tetratricopeptide (TPR) repeat protein
MSSTQPALLIAERPSRFDPSRAGMSDFSRSAIMGNKEQERKPVPQARIICQGEYWTLAFADRLIRLRDSKGLRQLALLLREPGREFHVLDLLARIDPAEIDSRASRIDHEELAQLTVRSSLGEDGGTPPDAQARAAYKQRLVELTDELEEAREFHDDERVARIEDEIDLYKRELKTAFGLGGGRSRKAGSAAEQARVNVTKNIGRALDLIEAKHESLGRLMKSTIRTGIFCSYQPDPRFPVAWSFEAEQPSDTISSEVPDRWIGGARPGEEVGAPPTESQPEHGRPPVAGGLAWGRFIGRAQEMAVLRAAIDAAVGGQASLVMVAGEPGMGKTRLVEEAGAYARLHRAQVLVGRCYEGEAASPYSPFVEIIREYVSTRPDHVLKTAMGEGASDVAKLVPEIHKRIPDLSSAAAANPNGERLRLFDGVTSFLVSASKANPIVLQLEDLHWADQPSLLLLQHIARRFKGGRLIVVGTYRDVELDRSHPLSGVLAELRHERLHERLLLRRLSESEVRELIEAILQQKMADGSSAAFVRAVLRETEGNPFFIEEVLRHLVESRGLYRSEGRWVTDARSIAELGIPEGVRDVISRRLSRLSQTTNRVLTAAAVLGREFEFELLAPMTDLSEDQIVPVIDEAHASQIVVETRGQMRPRYAFAHALVRHTLYEELGLPRKQRLHLKAAQAIEAAHERNLEPHVVALANHYRMAGAAAEAEKTIEYSIRAGRAAYAVFAFEEAGAHWRAALELMDEHGGGGREQRARLLGLLGDELVSPAKAIEYLEAAALLFEELGDHQAACDVHIRLAGFLSINHGGAMDMRRAMPHYKKAEAFLATQPESHGHATFYISMAATYSWTKRIGEGLAAAKRAMEISERLDQPFIRDAYWSMAAVLSSVFLVHSGLVTEGLQLAEQARQRADSINNTMVGSAVALSGGGTHRTLRNPREAQRWFTRELVEPRTAHALRRLAPYAPPRRDNTPLRVHDALVTACIDAGELAKARAYLAEVEAAESSAELLFFEGEWEITCKMLTADFERSRATGNRQEELSAARDLARAHRFSGERAEAVQVLQWALEISVDGGDILRELTTRSALATMAADAGDAGEALPHLERCRQIVTKGENWFGVGGGVERAEAVVAGAQREYAAAETHFQKAIATFQHYCLPWEEADTCQFWGRALLAAGERARAVEKFDAAIEIYRSRGASTRFIEYVIADKMRAQGSKSTMSR